MYQDSKLHSLGALDLMHLLHNLHLRGFQRLRWMSYMAPNGLYLRCHIAHQRLMYANIYLSSDLHSNMEWHTSVGQLTSGIEDLTPYVDMFIRENPDLIEAARGEDPEYADWFASLLPMAAAGKVPLFEVDYWGSDWQLPFGHISVGESLIPVPPSRFRVISWNIDGIKAHFSALEKLVEDYAPDVICLQKVKDINMSTQFEIHGYKRDGSTIKYGGIVTYVRNCIPCRFESQDNDSVLKGHFLKTEIFHPALTLYNVYVPYSNPAVKGAVEHRRDFARRLLYIASTTPDRQIICGDMNIVASEIDCWDGKFERNQANFHAWERNAFHQLLSHARLSDTFRQFNPFTRKFSYFFRNDPKVRAANEGHRIDYILASTSLVPQIQKADIIDGCTASSNNPILLDFRF